MVSKYLHTKIFGGAVIKNSSTEEFIIKISIIAPPINWGCGNLKSEIPDIMLEFSRKFP